MMEEQKSRRQYTREFKVEAGELLLIGDKTAMELAGNLGIRVELPYRWMNEYPSNRADAFSGTGHPGGPRGGEDTHIGACTGQCHRGARYLEKALAIFS